MERRHDRGCAVEPGHEELLGVLRGDQERQTNITFARSRADAAVLTHGVVENSPLQFTETARQREEWLSDVNKENWKSLAAGAHDALAPSQAPPAGAADGK